MEVELVTVLMIMEVEVEEPEVQGLRRQLGHKAVQVYKVLMVNTMQVAEEVAEGA
jgi:hypothetical protein